MKSKDLVIELVVNAGWEYAKPGKTEKYTFPGLLRFTRPKDEQKYPWKHPYITLIRLDMIIPPHLPHIVRVFRTSVALFELDEQFDLREPDSLTKLKTLLEDK